MRGHTLGSRQVTWHWKLATRLNVPRTFSFGRLVDAVSDDFSQQKLCVFKPIFTLEKVYLDYSFTRSSWFSNDTRRLETLRSNIRWNNPDSAGMLFKVFLRSKILWVALLSTCLRLLELLLQLQWTGIIQLWMWLQYLQASWKDVILWAPHTVSTCVRSTCTQRVNYRRRSVCTDYYLSNCFSLACLNYCSSCNLCSSPIL